MTDDYRDVALMRSRTDLPGELSADHRDRQWRDHFGRIWRYTSLWEYWEPDTHRWVHPCGDAALTRPYGPFRPLQENPR
jgi:hypothetical protein